MRYWLGNNQVGTRGNYEIISQNEENTQEEFFVTQEAGVKPRTEKVFDPGIISAKENLL